VATGPIAPVALIHDSAPQGAIGEGVCRVRLREHNALGWIAFMLVVIGIGVWTIFFSAASAPVKDSPQVTHRTETKNAK
jgi:hypothetical protein